MLPAEAAKRALMPRKNTTERTPPWEQGQASEPPSFGTWLRRQREIREVPLREIADVTKISLRYLEALEQDRFDVLPAPVFAKGFLREYSRYVGLDTDEVVNSFLTASGEDPKGPPLEEEVATGDPGRRVERRSWWMGLLALVAVAALAGLAYFLARARDTAPPRGSSLAVPLAPVEMPAAPPAEGVVVEQAPLVVVLDFTGDCWVEAVVDDVRRISELHVQGESMRIRAEERVVLTLGDPAVVRVEVNGLGYAIDRPPGEVARDIEIDLSLVTELAGEVP